MRLTKVFFWLFAVRCLLCMGYGAGLSSMAAQPAASLPADDFEQRLAADRVRLQEGMDPQQALKLTEQSQGNAQAMAWGFSKETRLVFSTDRPLNLVEANPAGEEEQVADTSDQWLLNGVLKLSGEYVQPDDAPDSASHGSDSPTLLIDRMATYKAKQRSKAAAQEAMVDPTFAHAAITLDSILATSVHHSANLNAHRLHTTGQNPYLSSASRLWSHPDHSQRPAARGVVVDAAEQISSPTASEATTSPISMAQAQPLVQAPAATVRFDPVPVPDTQLVPMPLMRVASIPGASLEQQGSQAENKPRPALKVHRMRNRVEGKQYFRRLQRF